MTTTATVSRERIYPLPARRGPAWYWSYEAFGPDGARFDNRSLTELRSRLHRKYGADLTISEDWK